MSGLTPPPEILRRGLQRSVGVEAPAGVSPAAARRRSENLGVTSLLPP